MRGAIELGVVVALICLPNAAEAQRTNPVRVAVGALDDAERLRSALHAALDAHPEVQLTDIDRAQLVLRGSIVGCAREATLTRCEVSLIVSDRGGSIRAMLRGRAGASGGGDPARAALNAAVRSALRPLADRRTLARHL